MFLPNDVHTWKSDSLLYPVITENQFQAITVGTAKQSAPNASYVASQKNCKFINFEWGTQQQNVRKKRLFKIRMVISKEDMLLKVMPSLKQISNGVGL